MTVTEVQRLCSVCFEGGSVVPVFKTEDGKLKAHQHMKDLEGGGQ